MSTLSALRLSVRIFLDYLDEIDPATRSHDRTRFVGDVVPRVVDVWTSGLNNVTENAYSTRVGIIGLLLAVHTARLNESRWKVMLALAWLAAEAAQELEDFGEDDDDDDDIALEKTLLCDVMSDLFMRWA